MKALKALKGQKVEAGWFESARYVGKAIGQGQKGKNRRRMAGDEVGESVARVARWNEFGTATIPARPFMRKAAQQFAAKRKDIQGKIARKLVRGEITPEQALKQIGGAMEGEIVDSMKNGGWPKNADSTIKAKGFDKPLFDTATMFQTITSKVS